MGPACSAALEHEPQGYSRGPGTLEIYSVAHVLPPAWAGKRARCPACGVVFDDRRFLAVHLRTNTRCFEMLVTLDHLAPIYEGNVTLCVPETAILGSVAGRGREHGCPYRVFVLTPNGEDEQIQCRTLTRAAAYLMELDQRAKPAFQKR